MTCKNNQLPDRRINRGVIQTCFVWLGVALVALMSTLLAAGELSETSESKPGESVLIEETGELSEALLAEIKALYVMDADPDYGEYLANECASCHSPKPTDSTAVPNIYGLDKEVTIANLVKYREGIRTNTTMTGVARALSGDDIAALAAYLADYQP